MSATNDAEHELGVVPTIMKSLPMLPHGIPRLWHAEAFSRIGGGQGAAGADAVERLDVALKMAGRIGTAAASCAELSRDDPAAGAVQQLMPSHPAVPRAVDGTVAGPAEWEQAFGLEPSSK